MIKLHTWKSNKLYLDVGCNTHQQQRVKVLGNIKFMYKKEKNPSYNRFVSKKCNVSFLVFLFVKAIFS